MPLSNMMDKKSLKTVRKKSTLFRTYGTFEKLHYCRPPSLFSQWIEQRSSMESNEVVS